VPLLAILVLGLVVSLVAPALAGNAALEVRLGPGLFSDLEILINNAVPNITAVLLPLPLPGKNESKFPLDVQIFDVSLVDLQINGVEVSLNPAAPGFMVAMCAFIACLPHSTLTQCPTVRPSPLRSIIA